MNTPIKTQQAIVICCTVHSLIMHQLTLPVLASAKVDLPALK